MPKTHRIFYSFVSRKSSFVVKDLEIFSKRFDVTEAHFDAGRKLLLPLVFLKQFWVILINLRRTSCFVTQFAGYQSFLPGLFSKITGIPSLIIAGGTDCVSFPSIHYGNMSRFPLSAFTKWSYRLSSHIAPVSQSLVFTEYRYQPNDLHFQGILHFVPKLRTPITVIHNGYDPEKWYCVSEKKKMSFTTVMGDVHRFSLLLKGIDLIIDVARRFPECEFQLLGIREEKRLSGLPENVIQLPPVPNSALVDHYSRNEFYLQLSMSEGFPNALSEAMLCECIPIVSNAGAMPEIVDDAGFILQRKDVDQLEELIRKALGCDRQAMRIKARNRIKDNYPEIRRENELLALVESLCRKEIRRS